MTDYLQDTTTKELLDNYFNILSSFGYTQTEAVRRFMVYFFLKDFSNRLGEYFTQKDITKISKALDCLFTGNCMLSYHTDSELSDRTILF